MRIIKVIIILLAIMLLSSCSGPNEENVVVNPESASKIIEVPIAKDEKPANEPEEITQVSQTDDSLHASVYPVIDEMINKDIIDKYLPAIKGSVVKIECIDQVVRVYIDDMSETEIAFALGSSGMNVDIDTNEHGKTIFKYQDFDGVVTLSDGSIFFEEALLIDYDLIIDTLPDDIFPKTKGYSVEKENDLIISENGNIHIRQKNIMGDEKTRNILQEYRNLLVSKYGDTPHKWDGFDVYEGFHSLGGALRVDINAYMCHTELVIAKGSTTKSTDSTALKNLLLTENSTTIYNALKGDLESISITRQRENEFVLADNNITGSNVVLYKFQMNSSVNAETVLNKLSDELREHTLSGSGGCYSWYLYEKEIIYMIESPHGITIFANELDSEHYDFITSLCNEEAMAKYLVIPSSLSKNASSDMALGVFFTDNTQFFNYFYQFNVYNTSLDEIIEIMAHHFEDVIGEPDVIKERDGAIIKSMDGAEYTILGNIDIWQNSDCVTVKIMTK